MLWIQHICHGCFHYPPLVCFIYIVYHNGYLLLMFDRLLHWGRDKMAAIFQTTFSNAFSWIKMYEFRLRFHWSLLLRVQLTIFQHWFRQWLGAGQATSHCLDQWWLIYWRIISRYYRWCSAIIHTVSGFTPYIYDLSHKSIYFINCIDVPVTW